MAELNQPIVIDNGSGVIKAGFAGGDKPRVHLRSYVGRLKHPRVMPGGALEGNDTFVGSKVEEHRGALTISYPIENGVVTNWADMERLWYYLYSKDNLNVAHEDHAVLLTEAPLNPYHNREKAAEIFFEGLNVPALYVSIQAILSLFASGRTTGVVLDSGDGVTHVVPVYEGLAIPHAIQRIDVAGRAVTQQLQMLLRRQGYHFQTSAEFEIVRQIKEQCCMVAFNPSLLEEQFYSHSSGTNASSGATIGGTGAANATSTSTSTTINPTLAPYKQTFKLPDGNSIELTTETFRAPEILFAPELLGLECKGIPDQLLHSIMKTDIDLRKRLLSQIVLAGGSTLFPGYGERLLNELRKHTLTPKECKVRIAAPPERLHTTWIGGSILASLSTFKNMWVTKSEYLDHGPRIFSSKSL
jgi:centractin